MVTLSHDAQSQLDHYLRQVKAALRGHPSVDAGEVERDVVGHIDAELAGQPEPVNATSLQQVLDRLGTPDMWVPSDELPAWRRVLNQLHSGPEDWRLAYATFVCFVAGFWVPPLLIASLPIARATVAQLDARGEAIGARRWLVYPPLVLWYAALVILLLIGPTPLPVVGLEDGRLRDELSNYIEPFWLLVSGAAALTLGLWWTVLGLLLRRFDTHVRTVFWPFADWFTRRHATTLIVTGALVALLSGGVILVAVTWRSTPVVAAQTADPTPAVPTDPVTGILDAFRTHNVVALGEGTHGNEQAHAFRLGLLKDRRFAGVVDDIVVESGNARYQDVMDRFVRGDEVSSDVLRKVWQDTTQPDMMWDLPIYEEFFRAVRQVNASLRKDQQLRVLLGDPPIDWDAVRSAKDYGTWDRDGHPVNVIQREILEKNRRALVVYGDLHFIRRNPRAKKDEDDAARSIVGLLERGGAKVFNIRTIAYGIDLEKLQPDVVAWPRPSLTRLPGTVLGAASFSSYYPRPLVVGPDGKPAESPEERRRLRMEEQFDALLYLGPQSTITRARLSSVLCADENYVKMRAGRMALLGLHKGLERLKQECRLSRVPRAD